MAAWVAVAAALGGCSIGPGKTSGGADLTITRDYGKARIAHASVTSFPKSETVMRFLQRNTRVETRYGGRFVNAIDGVRSKSAGGARSDWFYYVNGIEADVGAAEKKLERGDRVWWDHHDWSAVMRVPAVVGSFPEPFVHGSDGKRFPVRIDCAQDAGDACKDLAGRLDRAGITVSTAALGAAAGKQLLRFVVGTWSQVRHDGAARQIEQGPEKSGVFTRVTRAGDRYELQLLDSGARVVATLHAGSGLVAATRFEEQQPTWVVTGVDETGLATAVDMVSTQALRDRFAIAVTGRGAIALPISAGDE